MAVHGDEDLRAKGGGQEGDDEAGDGGWGVKDAAGFEPVQFHSLINGCFRGTLCRTKSTSQAFLAKWK